MNGRRATTATVDEDVAGHPERLGVDRGSAEKTVLPTFAGSTVDVM
ncbi:hypothetical protein [Pseudofrankia saprophytica]|nr:hypothetical protein [Pseudofrankia saprophytica]